MLDLPMLCSGLVPWCLCVRGSGSRAQTGACLGGRAGRLFTLNKWCYAVVLPSAAAWRPCSSLIPRLTTPVLCVVKQGGGRAAGAGAGDESESRFELNGMAVPRPTLLGTSGVMKVTFDNVHEARGG